MDMNAEKNGLNQVTILIDYQCKWMCKIKMNKNTVITMREKHSLSGDFINKKQHVKCHYC